MAEIYSNILQSMHEEKNNFLTSIPTYGINALREGYNLAHTGYENAVDLTNLGSVKYITNRNDIQRLNRTLQFANNLIRPNYNVKPNVLQSVVGKIADVAQNTLDETDTLFGINPYPTRAVRQADKDRLKAIEDLKKLSAELRATQSPAGVIGGYATKRKLNTGRAPRVQKVKQIKQGRIPKGYKKVSTLKKKK